jgi:predicted nucleic-acid-binding Zn-ribbon protein
MALSCKTSIINVTTKEKQLKTEKLRQLLQIRLNTAPDYLANTCGYASCYNKVNIAAAKGEHMCLWFRKT